jgi:hypothetical protein
MLTTENSNLDGARGLLVTVTDVHNVKLEPTPSLPSAGAQ